ncbi:MAG: type IV toxin-antitoxin system AbiEi family antitoxin [Marmoricola sp.]
MLDLSAPLLDDRFPLPLDRPFTTAAAYGTGLTRRDLGMLVRHRLLRRILRGVLVPAQVPDSLELRCRSVRLLIPRGAVVTDRTAGWLHGAEMILAPGAHLYLAPVSFFHRTPGCRSRAAFCDSGERTMPDSDVTTVDGIEVTTPRRTALDLGRLQRRAQALAALDSMLRLGGFDLDELVDDIGRFKGFRGVRQLRALAPLADRRSQSPGESALRLHWLDCADLPRPTPQVPVPGPGGRTYYLDLGVEELRFAAEYDGLEWHGPERAAHDAARRDWVTQHHGWAIEVFRKDSVFGQHRDADVRLRVAIRVARQTLSQMRRSA